MVNMKPSRFARQHHPRYHVFYCKALRSRREQPLATSQIVLSTSCGIDAGQGFILAECILHSENNNSTNFINTAPNCPAMEHQRIRSGSKVIDNLINGGFEKDIITTIYGPSSSGKTNICILCAINCVKEGKGVIFVDTEGGFSIERFKQLDSDYRNTIEKIMFIHPTNFGEQKKFFEKLKEVANEKIGLIVIDSIAMLYRLELGKSEAYDVNKELGVQLSFLNEIARKMKIPVLLTNQVYSSFDNSDKVRMVGGDILKYSSKCLLELQKGKNSIRKIILRKHRSLPEEKEAVFRIEEDGLKEVEE